MRRSVRSCLGLLSGGVLAAAAGQASATWSILIVDTRTGEIALGSATCLTNLDLRDLTPVLITGKGAVTAQSAGDSSGQNRARIRDGLIQGVPLGDILADLALNDTNHQSRQYGMVDTTGGTLTFTGANASAWAGGQTGQHGDLVWAVQGNILTGPNVVQGAVDAIIQTEGDLAAKLMAAMIASRVEGGDGRCSCAPSNATGCGSPPPGDFKSAHIGYMLVARIGDRDASRGFYPEPGIPAFFATPDLFGDGQPDMVTSQNTTGLITLYHNTTPDGSALSTAERSVQIDTGAGQIIRLAHADIDGDGLDDLVYIATGPAEVGYLPGDGKGSVGTPVRFMLDGAPTGLAVGDLAGDGRDRIVVSIGGLDRVLVLGEGGSGLGVEADLGVPGGPAGLAIAPIDADALPDIVAATTGADGVAVLRNEGGKGGVSFANWWSWSEPGLGPVDVAAGDLTGNGLGDIGVIGGASRRLRVLRQTEPGVFGVGQGTLANTGRQVEFGRFTPDGSVRVITLATGNRTIELHRELDDQPGQFGVVHAVRAATAQFSFAVADTNGDGLDDIVSGGLGRGLTLIDNLGDATFPEFNGFANGDYFLALNVANTFASAPDPVDTMAAQFQDWRNTLEGRPDAVRCEVVAPSRVARGAAYTVRVHTRDWRGDPVAPAGLSAEAFVVSGGGQVVAVRTPEPGLVEIDLIADADAGTDTLGVRLEDGLGRPVRLMPDPSVWVLEDLADFNGDGRRDFFDLRDFLIAFGAQDPAADLNQDGQFNFLDLSLFIDLFTGP
ncbi:MAG: DUF1028 domain-containing protein [Phycisphaerales bacterium]|nr:DUF1028 domain-containing protein [Planctomycetota bacterium]MCH8508155.1 DUF1028 domain-containing protein [Phycisphaerales bacterium]